MTVITNVTRAGDLPSWLPQDARHYLEHTSSGRPIRSLARGAQVHASTVLRQIRKIENAREDPLIDDALRSLSARLALRGDAGLTPAARADRARAAEHEAAPIVLLTESRITREAGRVLRRLSEQGAVLAMARDMDNAVVVRTGPDGEPQRVAVVERDVAQALALKEWITSADPSARVVRYRITAGGRTALRDLMAQEESGAAGFAEGPAGFAGAEPETGYGMRPPLVESPLYGLARRRDREGVPFLDRPLVAAGERLREDYELSQMDPRLNARVEALTDGVTTAPEGPVEGSSSLAALIRVEKALFDLGPGLGDVALRACCLLEGMETLEKRMGWSARSAKIVLRIALQRLQRHYFEATGKFGPRIG